MNSIELTTSKHDDCEKLFAEVKQLYEKYEKNEYMLNRLQQHILKKLATTLEIEDNTREKRISRTDFLTNEQQLFIQVFLNENKYYYLSHNKFFVYEKGTNYCSIKEDMIHYQLLTSISNDRKLMDWKYKTKINIIKLIKERNLFTSSIPESITIQKVLHTFQPLFSSKNHTKYFLTVLGDTILKKHNNLIFLIKPKTKKYLNELESIITSHIGITNIFHNFVTKYHDSYSCENCRLIKINNDNITIELWKDVLMNEIINICCVATHYSQRFKHSDNYIQKHLNNEELKNYVMYLKHNDINDALTQFCSHSIDINTTTGCSIGWKNMHLIWKLYMSRGSLPNLIYSHKLKNMLKEKYTYNETTDSFENVTSKYLPYISTFIDFWNKTVTLHEPVTSTTTATATTVEGSQNSVNELELDELCILYKSWRIDNNIHFTKNTNENDILKLLDHFFPHIQINENKYIMGVSCSLWNKSSEIDDALYNMRREFNTKHLKGITENVKIKDDVVTDTDDDTEYMSYNQFISFDDVYTYYNTFIGNVNKNKQNSYSCMVSKRFFNNYIREKLANYIKQGDIISHEWYTEYVCLE